MRLTDPQSELRRVASKVVEGVAVQQQRREKALFGHSSFEDH